MRPNERFAVSLAIEPMDGPPFAPLTLVNPSLAARGRPLLRLLPAGACRKRAHRMVGRMARLRAVVDMPTRAIGALAEHLAMEYAAV